MGARALTTAARRGALAVLIALAVLATDARAAGRPTYGGELVGSLLGAPVVTDPARASTHAEIALIGLVCDTLYAVDLTGRARPHLAIAEPEVDASGLWARVRIPRGVRFHDGGELTAVDVAASLERARKSGAAGWLLAPVRAVSAETDELVLIQLRRPTPGLAALLASPATAIVSSRRPPAADTLVGTGPFSLRAIDRAARTVRLDAHELHFAGRPYVDGLELRWYEDPDAEAKAYEAGRTDFSLRGEVAFVGHRPRFPTASATGPATVLAYVGFGRAHGPLLADLHFRRALSLAIDRESFRYIGSGEPVVPAVVPAPAAIGGTPPRGNEGRARVSAARRELRGARADTRSVTLEILVDASRPDDRAIAEKVAAALLRLDVPAKIEAVEARELARRAASGACDLYVGQLATLSSDPVMATAAGFMVAGDAWPARALARRALDEVRVEAVFRERLPVIPLFHRAVRAHYRQQLRGLGFGPLGRLSLADLFAGPR